MPKQRRVKKRRPTSVRKRKSCSKNNFHRLKKQTGGLFPLLIPALIAAGKAIAAGAVSGAAGYGVKKALDAATKK